MITNSIIVDLLNRHLVALYVTLQKGSENISYAITAFILSVSDRWFLITAGHWFRDIEIYQQKGYKLTTCHLIDCLGLGASYFEPIPFSFKDSYTIFLSDDYAIDYGVVMLSLYYRHLLETNNIVALNEEVWNNQPSVVDFYKLLGIPRELVTEDSQNLNIISTLHGIEPINEKPDGYPEIDIPQFFGRITLGDELTTIEGMSGGPIFAFHQNEKGEYHYWLIALQSTWIPKSRIIGACPTKVLGLFLSML
jgi:hypothetical protein